MDSCRIASVVGCIFLAAGGCARTVNDYLVEAKSNSPESVRDAVIAIGKILQRKESAGIPFNQGDEEALLYLRDVAAGNPVPMNRAAALSALGKLHKSGAGEVFRSGLRDPFWVSRLEAARAIRSQPEEIAAGALRDAFAAEARSEVRLEIVKALGATPGDLALKTLLEIFLRREEGVKDPQVMAFFALRERTGFAHGFDDVQVWKEYYRSRFGDLPSAAGGRIEAAPAPESASSAPPPAPKGGDEAGKTKGDAGPSGEGQGR